MPRPVGYGRPGTKVIPDGWQESNAKVVEGTFDCTVEVGRAGMTAQWNEANKQTESVPAAPAYDGPASITPVEQDSSNQVVDAGDVIPTRQYAVKLPWAAAAVEVDHIVTVVTAPDPMLAGRRLRVTSVEMSSRRFSRLLIAVDAD